MDLRSDGLGPDDEPARAGLYDGFESYMPTSEDDLRRVFSTGLVALDTNALLNLYRYTEQARHDLLAAMDRVGEQLWIPRQAVEEFWLNRETVLSDLRGTTSAIGDLEALESKSSERLASWARRVSLPRDRLQALQGELSLGFRAAITAIESSADRDGAVRAIQDPASDTVLSELERALRGRVGPPLSDEAYGIALEEARRRADAGIPPGYRDRGKAKSTDGNRDAGDYLIWEQLLLEAERRDTDVLLVTGDVKDDWWRRERGELRGPRVELARELRHRTGRALLMLTPDRFLTAARTLLGVRVHDESVRTAEQIGRRSVDESDGTPVERYWRDYLSASGRRFYRAAATVEQFRGPGFTLDDIAESLSVTPESVRSYHRNSGRSARRWREDTESKEPIRLNWITYAHDQSSDGMRTAYRLPEGVADEIQWLKLG